MSMRKPCPKCGSKLRKHLGQDGHLVWARCRACGYDYAAVYREEPPRKPRPLVTLATLLEEAAAARQRLHALAAPNN